MILNDPYPRFQGHAIFDAEFISNRTIYRRSFNGVHGLRHALLNMSFQMTLNQLQCMTYKTIR